MATVSNVCRDKRQCTPLHHAVWTGQYDCVQLLIRVDDERALNTSIMNEMDLLVNLTNNCGDTPLHLAAQTVGVRVVAALLHVRVCARAHECTLCTGARQRAHAQRSCRNSIGHCGATRTHTSMPYTNQSLTNARVARGRASASDCRWFSVECNVHASTTSASKQNCIDTITMHVHDLSTSCSRTQWTHGNVCTACRHSRV